jgi:glycosyltransferase involved in cell wall biosynthesis
MPISILEAMRACLPVIVTKVGAISEMVQNDKSGILIEPGDSDAIAGAVIRLSEDSELRTRLARGARKEFEARFEVNACIQKLASVYSAMSAMD